MSLQRATETILRLFALANIIAGAVAFVALIASFPFETQVLARLAAKYGDAVDGAAVLWPLRLVAVLAMVGTVLLHLFLSALRSVMATVRAGDPFIAANADCLVRMGWALAGVQGLQLLSGGLTAWFVRLGVEVPLWSPSFLGWLGVLLAFVLARVFRQGAAMRDDLAMTV